MTTDPATPANRLAFARRLLAAAIERYEITSQAWADSRDLYPPIDPPRQPIDPEEDEERRAWRRLLAQADDDFDLAEVALAGRIQGLYDQLAPADRQTGESAEDYFVPRAVKHQGTVYVLGYSVYDYEPRTNIIATYRNSLVLDLDCEDQASES